MRDLGNLFPTMHNSSFYTLSNDARVLEEVLDNDYEILSYNQDWAFDTWCGEKLPNDVIAEILVHWRIVFKHEGFIIAEWCHQRNWRFIPKFESCSSELILVISKSPNLDSNYCHKCQEHGIKILEPEKNGKQE